MSQVRIELLTKAIFEPIHRYTRIFPCTGGFNGIYIYQKTFIYALLAQYNVSTKGIQLNPLPSY